MLSFVRFANREDIDIWHSTDPRAFPLLLPAEPSGASARHAVQEHPCFPVKAIGTSVGAIAVISSHWSARLSGTGRGRPSTQAPRLPLDASPAQGRETLGGGEHFDYEGEIQID